MLPSLVLFDLGDVLASFDPAPRIAEYAQRSGLSAREVLRRLVDSDFSNDCDRGRYSAEQMRAELSSRLGTDFDRAELLRLQAAAFSLRPEMLRLASEVARKTRVGILTNNSPLLEEAFAEHFPGLCDAFEPLLFSHRFGHTKPDAELFARATAAVGEAGTDILFIDDQEAHVTAARRAGWQARRFVSALETRRELSEMGLVGPEIS